MKINFKDIGEVEVLTEGELYALEIENAHQIAIATKDGKNYIIFEKNGERLAMLDSRVQE